MPRGLVGVMERFHVENLWMNRPWLYIDQVAHNFHGNYQNDGLIRGMREKHEYLVRLEEIADSRGTVIREVFQGAQIGQFTVLAPSKERYIALVPDMDKTPQSYAKAETTLDSIIGKILETAALTLEEVWDVETLSSNPEPVSASNETSVVQLGRIDGKSILLTGDAGPIALTEAMEYARARGLLERYPALVQVPHHGSRKNLTPERSWT